MWSRWITPRWKSEVTARDRQVANSSETWRYHRDPRCPRLSWATGWRRVVAPHRLTDPKAGPMIAVKLHILTRKTLGGIETDLASRVLKADGTPLTGLSLPVR